MGRRVHGNTTNPHFNRLVIKNGRRSFPSSTVPSLPSSSKKKRNFSNLERDDTRPDDNLPYMDYAPPLEDQPYRNVIFYILYIEILKLIHFCSDIQ
jgi:hypothetical protein